MTPTAWVFMIAVWAIVIGMCLYCFAKLLRSPSELDGDDESR